MRLETRFAAGDSEKPAAGERPCSLRAFLAEEAAEGGVEDVEEEGEPLGFEGVLRPIEKTATVDDARAVQT